MSATPLADPTRPYRRIVRRETHRSRSALAITLLFLLAVVALWIGTEAVLAALGLAPLLVAPGEMVTAVGSVPGLPAGIILGGAVVLAVLGLVVLLAALLPARRSRHAISDERLAVVVDDGVIASSLARVARTAARTRPDQARASVGRRSARIDITPASGMGFDRDSVQSAVDEELDLIKPVPRPRATLNISENGRI